MMAQSQCIVLDMDETLTHSFQTLTAKEAEEVAAMPHLALRLYTIEARDIEEKKGTGTVDTMLAIERPYVRQFMRFCCKRFAKVIIWSAGQSDYVHKHIRRLARGMDISNVYTFDDCAITENRGNLIHKPFDKFNLDPKRTFIVDDRKTAYIENDANGINIPRYNPNMAALKEENAFKGDMCLVRLMSYFISRDVADSPDVRLLRKNVFAQLPLEYPLASEPWISPSDGNCLYSSVVHGINEDRIFSHAVEMRLLEFRRQNGRFDSILSRRPLPVLLSADGLRYLVGAIYISDMAKTRAYLEHCKQTRGNNDELKWMEPFWTGHEYTIELFQRALLDKSKYWGDWAAIDVLSDILGVMLVVWDRGTKRLVYKTEDAPTKTMTRINLLHGGGHYDFIAGKCDNHWTVDVDVPAPQTPPLPRPSPNTKRRKIK